MNREHIVAQIVLRNWPFERGIGRMITKVFKDPIFKEDIAKVPTTDGIDLTVYTNDLIGRHIYLTGAYERSTIEVLCNFARDGDVLLDIGANIGYISATFLKNVPHSRVVAVDPQTGIQDLLHTNLSQFAPKRYSIHPVALSDHNGKDMFATTAGNTGDSFLTVDAPGAYPVDVRSAGQFLDRVGRVDLVKVDVEGHEETILESAKEYLRANQPRIVVFEEKGAKGAPEGNIGKMFNEIGYKIFGLQKKLFKNVLYPIRSVADCVSRDYVAVSSHHPIPDKAKVAHSPD
jgi:FkbM family methyltransferase